MNEKLYIETRTTAGELLFSNGIVEKHNKISIESFGKTFEDIMCESDIAVAWAVDTTNALQNCGDFTPNQLVFGHVITP